MKTSLVIFLLPLLSQAAQTRALFFNKTSTGAQFRLRCVGNPPINRCSRADLGNRGKSLCEGVELSLDSIQPFNCVMDAQGKGEHCKFANGSCAPVAKGKTEESEKAKKTQEALPAQEAPLPKVEDLPDVSELPDLPPAGGVKALPSAPNLRELKPLENLPPVEEVSPSESGNQ